MSCNAELTYRYDLESIAEHLKWVKSHSLLGALKRFRNTDKGTPLTKEQFKNQLTTHRWCAIIVAHWRYLVNEKALTRMTYAIFSKSRKSWMRRNGTFSSTFAHARLFTGKGHAKNSVQFKKYIRLNENDLLIVPIKMEVDEKELFIRMLSNKTD